MILSVSRRTDVPNYYSDWFVNRIKEGFLYVRNPMNAHQISRIDLSPDIVDCIVFWTKNPANMMENLECLKDYVYYFQFTLTGYGKDIEPHIKNKYRHIYLQNILSTYHVEEMFNGIPFIQWVEKNTYGTVEKIGKEKVIWRYDPILMNKRYTMDYHLKAFEEIASSLADYTEKVVISFVDLYAKTQRNTKELDIKQMTNEEMIRLVTQMVRIASKYNLVIESCAEKINLQNVGVQHGSCIDKKLIEKILGCKLIGEKDKNQREECRCFESVEVGAYNTCLNGCKYCYANFNDEKVKENVGLYNQASPLLCGNITSDDKITDRKAKSLKDTQLSFFDKLHLEER